MSSLKHAVRNGLVAAVVAGVVAGLVSSDRGAALTSAAVAGGAACVGSLLLGSSMDLEDLEDLERLDDVEDLEDLTDLEDGPAEFDA